MVAVKLLSGAVLGLCATAGAGPTYLASDLATPDSGSDLADSMPVLRPEDAPDAGQALLQNAMDASAASTQVGTRVLALEPYEYRPVSYSLSGVSSFTSLNNADAETISTLINTPDTTRRSWFSETAPGAAISQAGFSTATTQIDARGLLPSVPSIAVIPLPGALVSGAATLGLIGLAYSVKRLRRR